MVHEPYLHVPGEQIDAGVDLGDVAGRIRVGGEPLELGQTLARLARVPLRRAKHSSAACGSCLVRRAGMAGRETDD